MSTNPTVIVYAGRTAIGKFQGALANVPAPKLGATLVKDALAKTGVNSDAVNDIIMGQVLTAGVGQAPARQTAIYGGLSPSVNALTINKVCGSGLKAVMLGDDAIRLGEAKIVLAGGQENMTLAPHLLMGSRGGYKFGPTELKDSMQWDGLWDPYNNFAMGNCGEICAKEYKFTREQQDEFALSSYQKARQAIEGGLFKNEIVTVNVPGRKGDEPFFKDEEPFSVELDRLKTLRPAFDKEGTITAGNASSINDGAALLMLMDQKTALARGLKPLAKIIAHATYSQEPKWFTTAPIGCIRRLLEKTGLGTKDIDAFEINEAFAVVTMAAIKDLALSAEQVNPRGGAVALGHPIGASGARVLVTLLNHMLDHQLNRGLATLCIGGGEASGMIIERL